MFSGVKQGIF